MNKRIEYGSNIIFIYMMTPRYEMHTTNKVNYTSKPIMI